MADSLPETTRPSSEEGEGSGSVRIYVGGLGMDVTAGDMERAFSSLGTVAAVEIVRSDNRSFAYMDFHPNSDKALPKLMSMYNGCKWKGGKLKVEKAKEHYVSRLKREWSEDASGNSTTSIDSAMGDISVDQQIAEVLHPDKQTLRIFFPKLRKVKSLPIKGTGKHKYSFQRVEVPLLPVNFCDCEEHSRLSGAASQQYFVHANSVAHDKELSIMNSVMNKLLGKDADEKPEATMDADEPSEPPRKDSPCEGSEDSGGSDAENLVTNIGSAGRAAMEEQMLLSTVGKQHEEKDLNPQNDVRKNKSVSCIAASKIIASNSTVSKEPRKISGRPEGDGDVPVISSRKESKEGHPKVFSGVVIQTEENASDIQPSTRTSSTRVQKRSWKELVKETDGESFSISQVLLGIPTEKGDEDALVISSQKKDEEICPQELPCAVIQTEENTSEIQPRTRTSSTRVQKRSWKEDGEPFSVSQVLLGIGTASSNALIPSEKGDEDAPVISSQKESEESRPQELPCAVTKTEENASGIQPRTSSTWMQKRSWKELVGETGGEPFSISDVLPGIGKASLMAPIPAEKGSPSFPVPASPMKRRKEMAMKGSVPGSVESVGLVDKAETRGDLPPEEHILEHEPKASSHGSRNSLVGDSATGSDVCTFMRTADSEKEWARARAALSGYYKKRGRSGDGDHASSFLGQKAKSGGKFGR